VTSDWPSAPDDAIAATIIRWELRDLGVQYVLADGTLVTHSIGTADRDALARLKQDGKLSYADDDVRERYAAMKRAGIF
jgi:hypothetical protein